MYKSEEEQTYTISDIKKELYKLNQNFENLVKFIIDKHNINLNTELELYKIEIENIQNECKHNSVFILECPKIRGNYIHQSHNSNCKTCYNIECNDCKKILQCKSCYNNKETYNDYFYDAMTEFITNISNIQLYTIPDFISCDKKLHITRPKMREEMRNNLKPRLPQFFKERGYENYMG